MRSVTERQLKSVGPLFHKVTIELLRLNNVTFSLNSKSSDWFQKLLEIEKILVRFLICLKSLTHVLGHY